MSLCAYHISDARILKNIKSKRRWWAESLRSISLVIVSSLKKGFKILFITLRDSLDWMFCRCRFPQSIQPSPERWSCRANGFWRLLASRVAALPSLPCATSGSEPSACALILARNVCEHGYASTRPTARWACPRVDPNRHRDRWIFWKYASCVRSPQVQSKRGKIKLSSREGCGGSQELTSAMFCIP